MPTAETKLDIMEMAEALGIDEAINGSYPYLVDAGGVRVTKIVHGASLSVTEFGTTAAAATAIVAKRGAFLLNVNEMICDRPYALAIVHLETGAVLFVSSVYDV